MKLTLTTRSRVARVGALAVLLAGVAVPASAASTTRVKDINPEGHSGPRELTVMRVGDKRILFFRAWDGSSGTELWRSDGTSAGTKQVKDIDPGPGSSFPQAFRVMKVGTKRFLFFSANDGTSGSELWRSDGTAAGTKRVKDIVTGAGSSGPGRFKVMKVGTKRFLFFVADDGTSGFELWRSDGTSAGTKRVKDIDPGAGGSHPEFLITMKAGAKRFLFFRADDGTSGTELWRSDGTAAGTRRVKDINTGGDTELAYFTVMKVGTKPFLFFEANDGTSGAELWRSDGTTAGTKRVKDINPGPGSFLLQDPVVMKVGTKRFLFFPANDGTSGWELWRSDGTAAGTKRVKDIVTGAESSSPFHLTVMKVGTKRILFFTARDATSGRELWRSDGTGAATKRVKDIHLGGDADPEQLAVMKIGTKRFLFFQAADGPSGTELWRSDGTGSGTKRIADMNPGPDGSHPFHLTVMKVGAEPNLFFTANDGTSGEELWRHRP